jgi:hypothetical protein
LGAASTALLLALLLLAPAPSRAQLDPHNSLTLQWTASGDDGLVGQVSAYHLYFSTTPVGADTTAWWNSVPSGQRITLLPPLASAGQPDSTHVTGLTAGTTYYFVLVALDEAANQSGYSNLAVGTTRACNAPAAPPAGFQAAADTGVVVVTWTATADPLALALDLYRAPSSGNNWTLLGSFPLSQTQYDDTNVSAATTYRYRAAWKGSDCEGPPAGPATATTPGTGQTAAAPGGGRMHVYPNPSSGALQVVIDVASSGPQPVHLRLFDMNGRWVATVADGTYPAGSSTVSWGRSGRNGQRVAPGYYELLGTVGSTRVRERLVLLP